MLSNDSMQVFVVIFCGSSLWSLKRSKWRFILWTVFSVQPPLLLPRPPAYRLEIPDRDTISSRCQLCLLAQQTHHLECPGSHDTGNGSLGHIDYDPTTLLASSLGPAELSSSSRYCKPRFSVRPDAVSTCMPILEDVQQLPNLKLKTFSKRIYSC